MANNLRVIYENLADTATLGGTVATAGTSLNYLKQDAKHLVYRVGSKTCTINITLAASNPTNGIVLPACNLTKNATISVSVNGTPVKLNGASTVGAQPACPYTPGDAGTLAGLSKYSLGGGNLARAYWDSVATASLSVTISDTTNSDNLEFTRLVVGNYWSPKYNTSFGLQAGLDTLSQQARTESGMLVTTRGAVFKTLNFPLDWLDDADVLHFKRILVTAGIHRSIFVSLFPESGTEKEGMYQVYGKLTELGILTLNNPFAQSTSISLAET